MSGKLRHIAISVPDLWAVVPFYEQSFGMRRLGETVSSLARGVYMTDGVMNVALLDFKDEPVPGGFPKGYCGVIHFGMWVDDLATDEARIKTAGGVYMTGRKETGPNVYSEVKYRTPENIVFDITESGWKGAVKNVVPA